MKIQVLSDLHREFLAGRQTGPAYRQDPAYQIAKTDADVVVLAGDIDVGTEVAVRQAKRLPSMYQRLRALHGLVGGTLRSAGVLSPYLQVERDGMKHEVRCSPSRWLFLIESTDGRKLDKRTMEKLSEVQAYLAACNNDYDCGVDQSLNP